MQRARISVAAEIEIRAFAGHEDIEALDAHWPAPAPDDGFAGIAFVKTGARAALALGRGVILVLARRDGRTLAGLALRLERRLGVTLGHALCDPVAQYTEMSGSWPAELTAADLQRSLAEAQIDALVLPKLRDDSSLARLLPPGVMRTHEMLAPALSLDGFADLEGYNAACGATTRKSRRQRQTRFAKLGDVAFVCGQGVGQETRKHIDDIIAMKRRWLDSRGLVSRVLHEPVWTQALRDSLLGLGDNLVLSRLTLDGALVAGEIGIVVGETYRSYLGAYEAAHAAHGVGALQLQSTIGWCIAQRLTTIDLMAPEDPYKRSWTLDAPPATLADRLWGVTARGRAFVGIGGRLEPGLRRAYSHLPPAVKLRIQGLIAHR